MEHQVGEIVKVRGREWIVQPESTEEILRIAPITGEPGEATGVLMSVEGSGVTKSTYPVPDVQYIGDHQSARLLRLSATITNRNTVGPFLSFGKIAVQPRPYQLVPLLLALRKDPVRILIADDVGIGKTVESLLIARELLDRGEIHRFCVLCPPHLAPQWQKELRDKFHIDAEVLSGKTAKRLEDRAGHRSVFEAYPFLVVSLDYIKVKERRYELLRSAPELVIVDEAHTCTREGGADNQLRYKTVYDLSHNEIGRTSDGAKITRHLILVTATPHTGKDKRFESLLGLLGDDLVQLQTMANEEYSQSTRNKLAQFIVQRRRQDIARYVDDVDTPFPKRHEADVSYLLSNEQFQLVKKVDAYYAEKLALARGAKQENLTYLSYHSIMRAISSSPEAAMETFKTRLQNDGLSETDIEDLNEQLIGDNEETTPDTSIGAALDDSMHQQFVKWSQELEGITGSKDAKLVALKQIIDELLPEGRNPIVFCHYVQTAEAVAKHLAAAYPSRTVKAVTGHMPTDRRVGAIEELVAEENPPILVATDCLSEGVNLQEHFDSVIHYDLSWNPTRHEQREGRVDRFNPRKKLVKTVNMYAENNGIDANILEVIVKKQRSIRKKTGVIVPAPASLAKLRYRLKPGFLGQQNWQATMAHFLDAAVLEWSDASERESKQRTIFAQGTIKEHEVKAEYDAIQAATAKDDEVQEFVKNAIHAHNGSIRPQGKFWDIDCTNLDPDLLIRLPVQYQKKFRASFKITEEENVVFLARTHPFTEAIADYVLLASMDPFDPASSERRLGVTYTNSVSTRTRLLLIRHRYMMKQGQVERILEEVRFHGYRTGPEWLKDSEIHDLLACEPSSDTLKQTATNFLKAELGELPLQDLQPWQTERCAALLASHEEIRGKAKQLGGQISIQPHGSPDVVGVYVFLPGDN